MLELLLTGVLAMGPCDIVDGFTEVKSCTEVTSPTITLGGLTLSNIVARTEAGYQGGTENGFGSVAYDLGPLPTEGYFETGVSGVCVDVDGTVVEGGPSNVERGQMYPGHYWTAAATDGGYVVGWPNDGCLSPMTRAAVVYLGYSETDPQPDEYLWGWRDNDRGVDVPGGTVMLTAGYSPSTRTGEVHFTALGATWDGLTDSATIRQRMAQYFNGNDTSQGTQTLRYECHNAAGASIKTANVPFDQSSTWTLGGTVRTSMWINATCPDGTAEFIVAVNDRVSPPVDGVYYSSVDASGNEHVTPGYDVRAYLFRASTLDAIVWRPLPVSPIVPNWVCTTWDCVKGTCGDLSAFDVVGYLDCFFTLDDFDLDELVGSFNESAARAPWYQVISHSVAVLNSLTYSFEAHNGQCGTLFESNSALFNQTVTTCDLPMSYELRSGAEAFLWLGGVFVLIVWAGYFLNTLKAPGLGKIAEE